MTQQLDKTLYDILGVSPDATYEEIRNAYRLLARQQHPDTGGKATTEGFIKITDAYRLLSNPSLRRVYDSTIAGNAQRVCSATYPSEKKTKRRALEALRLIIINSIHVIVAYGAELFWIIRAYAVYALIIMLLLAVVFVVQLIQ